MLFTYRLISDNCSNVFLIKVDEEKGVLKIQRLFLVDESWKHWGGCPTLVNQYVDAEPMYCVVLTQDFM